MKKSVKSILSLTLCVMLLLPSFTTAATELINDFSGQTVEEGNDNKDVIIDDITEEVNEEVIDKIDSTENKSDTEFSNEKVEEIETTTEDELNLNEETEASEGKESDVINEVSVGEKYEVVEGNVARATYSVEMFEREEFNLKYPTLIDTTALKKKTNDEYEIALAHSDGSYTYIGSSESFEEAKAVAENSPVPYSDDMVLPVVINREGQVAYSTRTMGRIWKHVGGQSYPSFDKNTTLYTDSGLKNSYNYINQGYVDDVPVIEFNNVSAKIQVSGHEAWINKNTASGNYDLVLVPINQVTNPSYYKVEGGILYHFISSDLRAGSQRGTTLKIGPAPEYLQEGVRYLSYDGRYFYNGSNIAAGLDVLISDLQSGHKNNSVNANNAYYNYYNYLPFRSRTMYTANDLNRFIEANTKSTSKLRGTGQAFIDAQNTYGVNALLALGVGINESAWGESSIAHNKNNIFGMNAVDSSPGESANYFNNVRDSIIEFCNHYISRGYADPADWRYFGGFLGNKNMGANIKYASDPFWGEKAASYAFRADMYLSGENIYNLKDYNAFQVIMFTGENEVKTSNNTLLYKINGSISGYGGYPGTTAIVTNKNEQIVNGVYSLEIYPERNTPINNGGDANRYHGNYDWSNKAYIQSKNIVFINASKSDILPVDPSYANMWRESNGKRYYYDGNGSLCKGWKAIDGHWYFFDRSTSELETGWLNDKGTWYYLREDGKMATGLIEVKGKYYYLDGNGKMQTGWRNLGGTWYYFHGNGDAAIGWLNDRGTWYYLYEDGKMATGLIEVGGKYYYLNGDGKMQTGWQKVSGTWYYFHGNGAAAIGWLNDRGTWYYLREDGKMATGLIEVKGKYYYLDGNGKMQTGWRNLGGTWYYFYGNGDAAIGWIKDRGTWYYLYEDGKMATGLIQVKGKYYYLDGNGKMQTGWRKLDGIWYYFLPNGDAQIGWSDINGKRYYFYEDGKMAADTIIDGVYVNQDGAAQ